MDLLDGSFVSEVREPIRIADIRDGGPPQIHSITTQQELETLCRNDGKSNYHCRFMYGLFFLLSHAYIGANREQLHLPAHLMATPSDHQTHGQLSRVPSSPCAVLLGCIILLL